MVRGTFTFQRIIKDYSHFEADFLRLFVQFST